VIQNPVDPKEGTATSFSSPSVRYLKQKWNNNGFKDQCKQKRTGPRRTEEQVTGGCVREEGKRSGSRGGEDGSHHRGAGKKVAEKRRGAFRCLNDKGKIRDLVVEKLYLLSQIAKVCREESGATEGGGRWSVLKPSGLKPESLSRG